MQIELQQKSVNELESGEGHVDAKQKDALPAFEFAGGKRRNCAQVLLYALKTFPLPLYLAKPYFSFTSQLRPHCPQKASPIS